MHPTLLELGPLTIHTYGFFIAAAFLAGMGWTMREARQRGLSPDLVSDLAFWIILGAILGSRLLYVLLNISYFIQHPLEIFMFWKGGLVFLGGVLLAAGGAIWLLRSKGQRILPWADTFAPGLALGQALGRLGCLAAGCCYGKACDLPWAITFRDPDSLAPLFTSLHPTQLYESLSGLSNFLILLAVKRRIPEPGRLTGVYLMVYSTLRIAVEFFRDDFRGEVGPFSVTQLIAAGLFMLGALLLSRKTQGVA